MTPYFWAPLLGVAALASTAGVVALTVHVIKLWKELLDLRRRVGWQADFRERYFAAVERYWAQVEECTHYHVMRPEPPLDTAPLTDLPEVPF